MDAPKKRFSIAAWYFSFIERRKSSDKLLFNLALLAVCVSSLVAIFSIDTFFTKSFPTAGGTLVEGVVGTPRFVNPVIAINRADHDMSALIYSGLMRKDNSGTLVPDLAESVTLGEDKKTYTVVLRKDNRFHNGLELKARDVAFTIGLIQNPELKSPLRGTWDGVLVEEQGDYDLTITLPEAHTAFIENLTVGILPRELWDELPIEQIPFSQNNTEPIGSGPYKIQDVLRSKAGLINGYVLEAFVSARGTPNIQTLTFVFYQDEQAVLEALKKREITSTPSLSLARLSEVDTTKYALIQTPLPRTFGIYLNQNKSPALRDHSARLALSTAIDRDTLVEKVLLGYGESTNAPVVASFAPEVSQSSTSTSVDRIEKAQSILRDGGWQKNADGIWEKEIDKNKVTLSFALSTANTSVFDETATEVANIWKAIGVDVSVSQFEQTDLVQSVIRPRDFETLLYGADVGRSVDLYPFWHSSQKNDPGLNIAQYTNIEVDALLRKLRTATTPEEQNEHTALILRMLEDDVPAVFLFAPSFVYVIDKEVQGVELQKLARQSERFSEITKWHMQSRKVWPIFSNN